MAQAVRPQVQKEKVSINQPPVQQQETTHLSSLEQSSKALQDVRLHPMTESDSIVFVKNLVSASIGSLAFLRGLFSSNNFDDDYFKPPDDDSKKKSKGKDLHVKRLKTGISKEADILNAWIENGVYDALNKRYLQNIIFTIFADPEKQADDFEMYIFSFNYSNDKVIMDFGSNLPGDSNKELDPTSYQNAATNLFALIHKFLLTTQHFGPLAPTRYASMKLLYTPNTPANYQPPDFQDCTGSQSAMSVLVRSDEDLDVHPISKQAILGNFNVSVKIATKGVSFKKNTKRRAGNQREAGTPQQHNSDPDVVVITEEQDDERQKISGNTKKITDDNAGDKKSEKNQNIEALDVSTEPELKINKNLDRTVLNEKPSFSGDNEDTQGDLFDATIPNNGFKVPSLPGAPKTPARGNHRVERGPTIGSFSRKEPLLSTDKKYAEEIPNSQAQTESQIHLNKELLGMIENEPQGEEIPPTQLSDPNQNNESPDKKGTVDSNDKAFRSLDFNENSNSPPLDTISESGSEGESISNSFGASHSSLKKTRKAGEIEEDLGQSSPVFEKKRRVLEKPSSQLSNAGMDEYDSSGLPEPIKKTNSLSSSSSSSDFTSFIPEYVVTNDETHRCICNQTYNSFFHWIECEKCGYKVHAYCEGYFTNADFTDPRFVKLSECLHCQKESMGSDFTHSMTELKSLGIERKFVGLLLEYFLQSQDKDLKALDIFLYDDKKTVEKVCRDLYISPSHYGELIKTFTTDGFFVELSDKNGEHLSGSDLDQEGPKKVRGLKFAPRKIKKYANTYLYPGPEKFTCKNMRRYDLDCTVKIIDALKTCRLI